MRVTAKDLRGLLKGTPWARGWHHDEDHCECYRAGWRAARNMELRMAALRRRGVPISEEELRRMLWESGE